MKVKKNEIGKDACCQPTGTVLDKIQAELAETRRREDELKRSRRQQLSRSQPDLTKVRKLGPPNQTKPNQLTRRTNVQKLEAMRKADSNERYEPRENVKLTLKS